MPRPVTDPVARDRTARRPRAARAARAARAVRALAAALLAASAVGAAAARRGGAGAEPFADFVEPSFPFIVSTVDAGRLGPAFPERNLAVRCVVLLLGHDTYACFDTDLLRVAVAWRGAFVSLTTMAQVSYQEPGNKGNAIPRVLGRPVVATGVYPGWAVGEGGADFRDPRPAGPHPDAAGRGPIAADLGRWNGIRVAGREAELSYAVAGTEIRERLSAVEGAGEVGVARTVETGPVARPLTLVVADVGAGTASSVDGATAVVWQGEGRDTATAVAVTGAPAGARLHVERDRHVTLRIPAGAAPSRFRVVAWRGRAADRAALAPMLAAMLAAPPATVAPGSGGPRWPGRVTMRGEPSPDTAAYVVDRIPLPLPNPWRRNVRVADLDFLSDGRAAVVTFEGDVWLVSGLDRGLAAVAWTRFASGLYEPLSLQVVRDTVYVHDRQGIVRLVDADGDGEADRYESFSNLSHQSGESREFPLGMAARPGGGFYLAIGGALDLGPKTSPAVMQGFRAGSAQSGTVQEVSADGRRIRAYATGLREPIIGVDPRTGTVAASDQQGNFVPSTPIFLLRDGGYYGVPATAHRTPLPPPDPPLLWIPHEVDQSGAGEVWVPGDGDRMGFGGPALVHLSYGRPGPFRVYVDSTPTAVQGALVALPGAYRAPTLKGRVGPRDGQLYLAGFSIWGSRATEVSSLVRLRHTGRPSPLPLAVRAGLQGVLVRFAAPLDPAAAADPARYALRRWNYVRSPEYGSGHFRLDGTPGQETLSVAAHLSADGRSVLLVVPGMRPVMQMQLAYDLRARAGTRLRDTLYLTVHATDSLDLAAAGFGRLDWRASARRAASAAAVAVAKAGPPAAAAAAASPAASAAEGAQVFRRAGCAGCHSVDGTTAGKTGPTLAGLYGSTVPLVGRPARRADAAYLRQSILDPASEIVQGYEPGMPSFRGVLADAEVESLLRYIQSLGARRGGR